MSRKKLWNRNQQKKRQSMPSTAIAGGRNRPPQEEDRLTTGATNPPALQRRPKSTKKDQEPSFAEHINCMETKHGLVRKDVDRVVNHWQSARQKIRPGAGREQRPRPKRKSSSYSRPSGEQEMARRWRRICVTDPTDERRTTKWHLFHKIASCKWKQHQKFR